LTAESLVEEVLAQKAAAESERPPLVPSLPPSSSPTLELVDEGEEETPVLDLGAPEPAAPRRAKKASKKAASADAPAPRKKAVEKAKSAAVTKSPSSGGFPTGALAVAVTMLVAGVLLGLARACGADAATGSSSTTSSPMAKTGAAPASPPSPSAAR
jgi:hypothetical protein